MRKGIVNCVVCGSKYEVCRLCPTTTKNTPWRVLCDSPVHYQVYHIVQDLKAKTINESEAKEMLENINITQTDVESFVPSVQDVLLPIFKADDPIKKKKKKSVSILNESKSDAPIDLEASKMFSEVDSTETFLDK